ncbi:23S rRNA (adenine(2503)-C(2))-methyltransferase RlmN [Patescibacteria group bacterium]|nr:MAG: 23S rRNA (adenine(2503)-C(2))-methyltransferase RlmN [Patescibacteria group bacterium]
MDRARIAAILEERKEPAFRMRQIENAIYVQKVARFSDITTLSKGLRAALENEPTLTLEPSHTAQSKDGTIKVLFKLLDGKEIEAVMIPNKEFRTICVSSQVGCAMKCGFCATGTMGFKRNLTADEIVDQVLYFERLLKSRGEGEKVTNVVFMGMGEPLQNLEAVLPAVEQMNDEQGLGLGARRISISTCGIVPGILKLADYPLQINLAVSLHAPNDEVRSKIMPVNRAYPLEKLMAACKTYLEKTNRKLFIEYVMLRGINDTPELARELGELLRPFVPLVQVNLIPFHQTFFSWKPTPRPEIERFQEAVMAEGVPCTIRHSAGVDIAAACGQLANQRLGGPSAS